MCEEVKLYVVCRAATAFTRAASIAGFGGIRPFTDWLSKTTVMSCCSMKVTLRSSRGEEAIASRLEAIARLEAIDIPFFCQVCPLCLRDVEVGFAVRVLCDSVPSNGICTHAEAADGSKQPKGRIKAD